MKIQIFEDKFNSDDLLTIGQTIRFVVSDVPMHWDVETTVLSRRVSKESKVVEYTLSDGVFGKLRGDIRFNFSQRSNFKKWKVISKDGKEHSLKSVTFEDKTANQPLPNEVDSFFSDFDLESTLSFYKVVDDFKIHLVKFALRQTGGHQRRAATLLGLNDTTLNSIIKKFKIDRTYGRAEVPYLKS